jgi:hypothetical protein
MDKTSVKTARYPADTVTRLSDVNTAHLARLLDRYGLELIMTRAEEIPGSYWGEAEAGLVDTHVYVRTDTPVHSVLHESCHYVCMSPARRAGLHTDAGGDYDEENAVCYLQILLAQQLPDYGSKKMLSDMDAWGYTFRLGSAEAWFCKDAVDAREWLVNAGIIATDSQPTWQLKQS